MSKQVSLAGGRIRLNETTLEILSLVAHHDKGPGKPAVLSKAEFSREVGCSMGTVQRSLSILVHEGFITVIERRSDDGGRKANAYALTTMGALVAEAHQRTA